MERVTLMAEQYTYINSTGVIVPDVSDTLATVTTEYKNVFGADLITTPDTPQGVLITTETTARNNVIQNNAALANQINPNLAGGVFLDAICALTGLNRIAATPSTVPATITGVSGTVIPVGSRAQTINGDVFQTTGAVTIGGDGTVAATFQSIDLGPIPAQINDLTQIIDGILGWETVFNTVAATLGQTEQSDQSLRALRKVTLAGQGVALVEAIISDLYKVVGVKSLTFQENVAATTVTINGISMIAHSIYACVDGGSDDDVAASLLQNKSLGAGWNGDTTISVTEPFSGQVYTVKFDRPDPISFKARVTITNNDLLIDGATAVKTSILAYANGLLTGEAGLVVGQDVSAFELGGAVTSQYPTIYVSKVETSIDGGTTWVTTPIAIAINQIATVIAADITVVNV